jgi:hypothetical protein
MQFLREHLDGFYNWPQEEKERSVYDGNASRRLFNCRNGNQVLFIINLLMDNFRSNSVDLGRKIERLIINKLPLQPSSEVTIFNWLRGEIVKK